MFDRGKRAAGCGGRSAAPELQPSAVLHRLSPGCLGHKAEEEWGNSSFREGPSERGRTNSNVKVDGSSERRVHA